MVIIPGEQFKDASILMKRELHAGNTSASFYSTECNVNITGARSPTHGINHHHCSIRRAAFISTQSQACTWNGHDAMSFHGSVGNMLLEMIALTAQHELGQSIRTISMQPHVFSARELRRGRRFQAWRLTSALHARTPPTCSRLSWLLAWYNACGVNARICM